MSVNSTSPATLFGGTWEQIKDTFLLGSGSYTLGATGGEATHTLTVDEMPSHSHGLLTNASGNTTGWGYNRSWISTVETSGDVIENTGGSKAHNNMPPYLVVNIWKRTA